MIKRKAGWILLKYVLKDSLLAGTLIAGWSTPPGRPDVTGHGEQIGKLWQASSNNTGSEPDYQP